MENKDRKKKLLVLVGAPLLVLAAVLGVALATSAHRGADSSAASGLATEDASSGGSSGASPSAAGSESRTTGTGDNALSTTRQAAVVPLSRAVVSTGQVTVRTDAIGRARGEVMRLVTSWDGLVADERTRSDDRGRAAESTLTLRVPTARFSAAMDALADLGEVVRQSRTSEDVTTKVVDNDARVRAAERSIRQIEALLGRAEKLGDVIAIESDLARRQADLDSLKSQQAYLADQTSLSTIEVRLSLPSEADPPATEARGFLAGLADGWSALGSATVGLLTALGAVLPFAVLLVVLGLPVWLLLRRRQGTGPFGPAGPEGPGVSGGSAPARSA